MIDLHSHILPGVDDGARTLEDSVELARAALEDGITLIAATPHVREDYPTTAETMERLVGELRRALVESSVELDLRTGGELALDQLSQLPVDSLRRFGLAGNPGYLLLEFPYYGWPLELGERVFRLRAGGVTPVLAHPERNRDVQISPERLRPLVEAGALVQVTAASLDGRLGRGSRAAGLALVDLGLAHLVASDAHGPEIRSVGMAAAAEELDDPGLAQWLTTDVPAAIVSGDPLPERPEPRRPRRRFWFKRA